MLGGDDGDGHKNLFDRLLFNELGLDGGLRELQHRFPIEGEESLSGRQEYTWRGLDTGVNIEGFGVPFGLYGARLRQASASRPASSSATFLVLSQSTRSAGISSHCELSTL